MLGDRSAQSIQLASGPNSVSLFVIPDDPSIEAIVGPLGDNLRSVKDPTGDQAAAVYMPSGGVKDLTRWDWHKAYVVDVREPAVLRVEGRLIDPASEVELRQGWNHVPYFFDRPVSAAEAFASIAGSIDWTGSFDGTQSASAGLLSPGRGYRLYAHRPDTLTYRTRVPSPSGGADYTVATLREAFDLKGLAAGQTIRVLDPIRGGRFRVTGSGRATDGGVVFVPNDHSKETTAAGLASVQTLYHGPEDQGIVFDSFRLFYGPNEGDYLEAVSLHGHTANLGRNAGAPVLDTRNGRLLIPSGLRTYSEQLTGSDRLRAAYRYATSDLRIERIVEPLIIEGIETTAYVRPEWWGARPYPRGWSPDPSPPPSPGVMPSGIVVGDPVFDATDALGAAINAAEAAGELRETPHYVILDGMYGFSRPLEVQDGAVLKGIRDGVRDGQGLRVLKGAPWHYWAIKTDRVNPLYAEERAPQDWLLASGADPIIAIRHGRDTQLSRLVDIEIDGNVPENDYVFTDGYIQASGGAGAQHWSDRVQEMLQNTPHWNGFVASTSTRDVIVGSNARLENVHIHDTGGNSILGNNPMHFGGSRDLKLGNAVRNHIAYGVFTAEGTTIDRIEIYGYWWQGGFPVYQGHYRDVTFKDLKRNPYFGWFENLIGHRNSAPDPSLFGSAEETQHYYGETVLFERLRIELPEGLRPSPALIYYDNGPFAIRGLTLDVEGDESVQIMADRHDLDQTERSVFELTDLVVERGNVRVLTSWTATGTHVRRVRVPAGSGGTGSDQGFLFRPVRPDAVATIYDVGLNGPLRAPELVKIKPRRESASLDVFVQRSAFTGIVEPVKALSLDPATADAQARYRIFWRDVDMDAWRDSNSDGAATRESGRIQYFERVTARGRSSEGAGSLVSGSLRQGSNGTGYIDVDPNLFYVPQDPSFVVVTGRDAERFLGWENVGDKYDPVLRLSFSGTGPVTASWSASIRPIPSGVAFPE